MTVHGALDPLEEIASELRISISLLPQKPAAAAWRVADAGFRLRQYLEATGEGSAIGVGRNTGIGVKLPNVWKPK